MSGSGPPGFLLDEHVVLSLAGTLRDRGVDARHALEEGPGGTSDPALLRWCQERDRILVTRNYPDFAPLVEMLVRRGETFPGVLFISPGIPHGHTGAHLRALETWLRRHESGAADVTGSFGWLGGPRARE